MVDRNGTIRFGYRFPGELGVDVTAVATTLSDGAIAVKSIHFDSQDRSYKECLLKIGMAK